MVSDTEGWIAVFVGLFFWGIFTAPVKAPAVQSVHLHGVVFQFLMSLSIFASSCIVLTFTNFVWTWWGFLGGSIWVCGNLCGIFAINNCGIATAQGVWAGIICIVSFFWGWLGQPLWADTGCNLANMPLAITGLGFLVAGITLITYFSRPANTDVEPSSTEYTLAQEETDLDSVSAPRENRTKGLIFALGCGVCAGSVLVPLKFATDAQGFESVFSFGVGILTTSLFWYVVALSVVEDKHELDLHFGQVAPFCLLSGVLWNVGNISSIIATQSSLGLTIAYPIMQNAMVISGLVGIFVYKEIEGIGRIAGFGGAILVISVGAFLLGTYAVCEK